MSAATSMKAVTLKDGRAVALRRPTEDDAQAMLDFLDAVRRETDHILYSPVDPLPTLDEEKAIIRERDGSRAVFLLAETDGEIAAVAEVATGKRVKNQHMATLAISVRRAYQGVGLGRLMMDELIGWCRRHPQVLKIQLTVFAENAVARSLYARCGFVEEGRMIRAVRQPDGRFVDEVMMGLWLEKYDGEVNTNSDGWVA